MILVDDHWASPHGVRPNQAAGLTALKQAKVSYRVAVTRTPTMFAAHGRRLA
jgi:hypothetical protein